MIFKYNGPYQDLCMQSRQAGGPQSLSILPRRNRNVREFLGIPGPDVPVVDMPEPTTRDLLTKIDQLTKTVASLQVQVSRGSSSQSRRNPRSKNAKPGGKKSNKKVLKPKNLSKIRAAIEKDAEEVLSLIRQVKEEIFCAKEVNFESIFCRSEFLLLWTT